MGGFTTILVRVTSESRTLETLAFKQERVTIGREPGMDVVLSSQQVSRAHCRLELVQGEVYVQDLESRNGTLLNGRPIVRAKMETGDNLQVGEFKLWFHIVATPTDPSEKAASFTDGPTIERA
jgi:pSer/pThr/pTyr-binding forkhead associated (FHA) protein